MGKGFLLLLVFGILELCACSDSASSHAARDDMECPFGCVIDDVDKGQVCGTESDCQEKRIAALWFVLVALACCIPTTIFCARVVRDNRQKRLDSY